MFCILKNPKHLVVMRKDICRPFCYVVQQEVLQVSKDMMTTDMSAGLFFFPAVFMKAKKKQKQNQNQPQHSLVSF